MTVISSSIFTSYKSSKYSFQSFRTYSTSFVNLQDLSYLSILRLSPFLLENLLFRFTPLFIHFLPNLLYTSIFLFIKFHTYIHTYTQPFQLLKIPAPWVLLHFEWSIPLVSPVSFETHHFFITATFPCFPVFPLLLTPPAI